MFLKLDPTFFEESGHAHYPACCGRMESISRNGHRMFFYTLIAAVVLSAISAMGARIQVISWIPMMICDLNGGVGWVGIQVLVCLSLIIMAALGCGKSKIFGVILLLIYFLMLAIPLFYRISPFDIFSVLIGGGGVFFGYKAPRDFKDYSQLRETEGFPLFNTLLTEYDEKKQREAEFEQRYGGPRHTGDSGETPQNKAPVLHNTVYRSSNARDGIGDMPELEIGDLVSGEPSGGRFVPKGGKEGTISDSPLKLK